MIANTALAHSTGCQRLAHWAMAILSVAVGSYGLAYLFAGPDMAPGLVRASRDQYPATFLTHVGSAGFALLIGAFQFNEKLRAWRIQLVDATH